MSHLLHITRFRSEISGGHSWWLLSEIIYYKVSQSVWLSVVSIRVRRVSWCEPPVNTPRLADQSPLSSATVNISHLCSAALSCVWSSQSEFLNTIISERQEMVVMVMTCVSMTLDQEHWMINVMRYCLRYGAIVQPSKLFRWKQCFCSRVTWTGSLVQFHI